MHSTTIKNTRKDAPAPWNSRDLNHEEIEMLAPFIHDCLALSHEINNPLAGILGYSEFLLIENDNLTEDQQMQIKHIMTCAEKILSELDKLSVHKIELKNKIDLLGLIECLKERLN